MDYINNISYRAFGVKGMNYTNGKTLSLQYDNRMRRTGFTYDLAGNVTNDGSQTFTYDATGQQATATAAIKQRNHVSPNPTLPTAATT